MILLSMPIVALPAWSQEPVKDPATGKYGFVDKNGKQKIKPIYDEVGKAMTYEKGSGYSDTYKTMTIWPVKAGNLWGCVNSECKEIVKPIYDQVAAVFTSENTTYSNTIKKEPVILVSKDKLDFLINEKGNRVDNVSYLRVLGLPDNNIYWCTTDGVWTVTDRLLKHRSSIASGDNDKFIIIKNTSTSSGNVNFDHYMIDKKTGAVYFIYQGIVLSRDSKYGYVSPRGEMTVDPKYDNIYVGDDLLSVTLDGKQGLFSKEGKMLAPIEYDKIFIQGPFAFGEKGGKTTILAQPDNVERNTSALGFVALTEKGDDYSAILSPSGNYMYRGALMSQSGPEFTYIQEKTTDNSPAVGHVYDKTGKEVPQAEKFYFSDIDTNGTGLLGISCVKEDKTYTGLLDSATGKIVVPVTASMIIHPSANLFIALVPTGVLADYGREVEYDMTKYTAKGAVAAPARKIVLSRQGKDYNFKENGKWGLMDNNLNVVIPAEYDGKPGKVGSSYMGYKGGNYYFMSKGGKIIAGPYTKIDKIYTGREGDYVVWSGNKKGVLNNGKLMLPARFDDYGGVPDGYVGMNELGGGKVSCELYKNGKLVAKKIFNRNTLNTINRWANNY